MKRSMRFPRLWLAPFLSVFWACTSTLQPIPDGWLSLPETSSFAPQDVRNTLISGAPVAPPAEPAPLPVIRVVTDASGARLFRDDTPLTPPYKAIESFDVSSER